MNDGEYTLLKRRIRELIGIDINAYKPQQMRRRLDAFVARRAGDAVSDFCRNLGADTAALEEMRNMLTINVSEFFRDPLQFQRLERDVLPELLAPAGKRLKIWSSACSHGEEPYSVALSLADLNAAARASILATDIDRVVLAKAKAGGPYLSQEIRNVSPKRLETYFTRTGDTYHVGEALRKRVEFRELNLLSDRFDSGFDLIICRNVMIYFSDETKARLFEQFHDALSPDGVLFVGGTEALLGGESRGFERIGGNFYRKWRAQSTRLSA